MGVHGGIQVDLTLSWASALHFAVFTSMPEKDDIVRSGNAERLLFYQGVRALLCLSVLVPLMTH